MPTLKPDIICNNDSAELIYNTTLAQPNDCLMTTFLVRCQSLNNMPNDYYLKDLKSNHIKITIDKLIPNTKYKCVGFVTNRGGKSNLSDIHFTTLEGVPSEPKNVAVKVLSENNVQITWDSPTFTHGNLTNYKVIVYEQSLLYTQAPGCSSSLPLAREVMVKSNTSKLVLNNLLAYMKFQVRVMAATKAGYGPLSIPVSSYTPIGDSDPVKNLHVHVTRNLTVINWQTPCITGGPLRGFLISLNGSRLGRSTANYTWIQTVSENLMYDYSVTNSTTNLTAEALYVVTITPIGNKTFGRVESTSFEVPSRIPATPNLMVALPEVIASSFTAVITFQSDFFPDTEGTIKYYSIILAENSFTHPPAHGWLANSTWPNVSTWAGTISQTPIPSYQATPMWWEPFRDMPTYPFAVKQYVIGDEACSQTDLDIVYCNGPLRPGTVYALRIRAFTSTGYRDSSDIYFTTDSLSSVNGTVLFFIFIILTLLIISVLVYITTLVEINRLKRKDKMILYKSIIQGGENISSERKGLSLAGFLMRADMILSYEECLTAEYDNMQNLSQKMKSTQIIALLPQNKKKNRYANIIPYDENRVVLEGDANNDYINASHIQFQEDNSVHYIACQGPPKTQCGSFWKMILQNEVNVIVMLCQPIEYGKEKCSIYYPKLREAVEFGDVTAYCSNEEEFSNYVMRSIVVKEGDKMREVKQYHFLVWPDHEVPSSPLMIMEFGKVIRQETKQKRSVLCVHCSAGVGRTGTFIAIDVLTRIINKHWKCKINVLDIVLKLRDQRCKMVQTEKQYEFIYKCLQYAIENDKSLKSRVGKFLYKKSLSEPKNVMPTRNELQLIKEMSELSTRSPPIIQKNTATSNN